jgi:hypothetical protein
MDDRISSVTIDPSKDDRAITIATITIRKQLIDRNRISTFNTIESSTAIDILTLERASARPRVVAIRFG